MRKTKYLKSNMNNSNFNSETQICNQRWARNFFGRLLGLKFVRALNNYSKWRRFWTSPVQVTKNLESSRLACTGIPSTTGSPKITKRSPNVERKNWSYHQRMQLNSYSFHTFILSNLTRGNFQAQDKKTKVRGDHDEPYAL